jgi:hypothetical protein
MSAKRLKQFMLLPALALLLSAANAQTLSFSLTPAAQSGVGTGEVFFIGALTNTGLTTNFLNNIQFAFTGAATNYLTADTNVFFANVPGILLPGETYADVVFGAVINPATPPGNYSGTVAIQGGTDIFGAGNLTNQTFQVSLPPAALGIARYGTNLVLSWPSPPGGFLLQQNADLATTNWTTATNTLTMTNFQNQAILPPSAVRQFYRLKYP